ncbi:IQ domain-containing protein M [Varanus komodoensis]|uniref:IQ domain-containing protein M n=1 Tax=Varanus komodoensis TaxID=61221 RepID=UPI001CF7819D|nr:IQ domain-containing protein M [Varanus komodoensis]
MKAKSHGTNLLAVVKEYRKMMYRIKHRCGILDLTTPLVFDQLEDWLDKKKFYETMFAKREFLKEMDRNDIPRFFRDCGRFPTKDEMDNAVKLVLGDCDPKIRSINKTQAVEIAFMLYPPCGLKLKTAAVAKSTWLKPIIDGEDGYRYLVSGHPALKAADIRRAGALVAASIRERKRKECEADNYLVDSD